ncbi:MAG: WGR domain-containing protein [Spirochaetales bacterium]|nr:WGR domain-containing protein [Spirochaetales bacterium]
MIITFYKTDSKGRPRYYSIHDRQGNLFSEYSFTIIWGMNLYKGREQAMVFETREAMDEKLRTLLLQKVAKGYKVLYSFSRDACYKKLFVHTAEQAAVV